MPAFVISKHPLNSTTLAMLESALRKAGFVLPSAQNQRGRAIMFISDMHTPEETDNAEKIVRQYYKGV